MRIKDIIVQIAIAQQQSSLVPTIDPRSGGAFLGHGSVMVMLTAVMLLMNTRTAHEDLAQKMSLPVVMACASVTHTGVIGGMTVVTAVMKEDASMNRVNSTSLLVRMGAAFPKPTSVMGIMTVVMNLMSWNISAVHQKQPALPIILNVTMETALSWLKSAIGWTIA